MTEIECVLMFRACYVRLSLDRTSLSDSSSCYSDKYLLLSISDLLWWNTRGLSYHLLVVIYTPERLARRQECDQEEI